MSKLLYVVGSVGHTSTTFVTDLIQGFQKLDPDFAVVTQSVVGNPDLGGARVIQSSFFNRMFLYRVLAKLFPGIAKRFPCYRLSQKSLRSFKLMLEREKPQRILVDFAINAVLFEETLRKTEIPYWVHVHGMDITGLRNDPVYEERLQRVFQHTSGIIAASHHIRRLLILAGAPENRVHVVRLEPMDFSQSLETTSPKIPNSIVGLGRFVEKKHPLALLEAFRIVKKSIPDAVLTVIGDGPLYKRFCERVVQYGLQDAVSAPGALPREEALKLVVQHEIFAQHSVTSYEGDQEGFGISLAEAALLGLPVISTTHNGIPEQVLHEETGLLCREYDYEEMAVYLNQLLQDPDRAKKYGTAGRKHIQTLCLGRSRASEILSLLQNCPTNNDRS